MTSDLWRIRQLEQKITELQLQVNALQEIVERLDNDCRAEHNHTCTNARISGSVFRPDRGI